MLCIWERIEKEAETIEVLLSRCKYFGQLLRLQN